MISTGYNSEVLTGCALFYVFDIRVPAQAVNANEFRQFEPMPWMRDALACLDSRGVRFAHPKC